MAETSPLVVGSSHRQKDDEVDAWRLAIFRNKGDSVDQALKFSAARVAETPKVFCFDLSDPVLRAEANQHAEDANKRNVSGALFVGETIEPVMRVQAMAVLLCFTSSFVMLLFGLALLRCDDENAVQALPFSTWGLLFTAFLLARVYFEFLCLRKFLIPFSQMVRMFKTMGFRCGFSVWLVHGLISSVSMALSQATQSLVVAIWVYGAFTCPVPEIDQVWHALLPHKLSFFPHSHLWEEITVVWLLAELFLLSRVLSYYPHRSFRNSSVPISEDVNRQPSMARTYQNIFGTEITNGIYFWALAEAAGMNVISKCACEYELYAARLEISMLNDARANNKQEVVEKMSEKLAFTLRIAVELFEGRLLLSGILRTVLPAFVQLTLLSVDKVLFKGNVTNTILSICPSLFTAVLLLDPILSFMWIWWSDIRPLVRDLPREQFKVPSLWWLYLVMFVFLALLIYDIVDFVLNLYCKGGLWSISEGCFESSFLAMHQLLTFKERTFEGKMLHLVVDKQVFRSMIYLNSGPSTGPW